MNDVVLLSREMNEPAWLLKERQEALRYLSADAPNKDFRPTKPVICKSRNIRIHSLEEMLKKNPKFAKDAFSSRRIRSATSQQAAYLNAFFRDCSFMFVENGKKAELDVLLGNSLSLNFVFVGRNSELRISGSAASDCMDICEIKTEEGSRVDCSFMKQKGAFAYRGLSATIASGSVFGGLSFWSGSGVGDTSILLNGIGSRAKEVELSIAGGTEELSLSSVFTHSANNTESEVIMRGVAQDKSRTVFNGRVTVEGNGRGSKSNLAEHILLLDKEAKAETNPVMEIKNNDVECSHNSSIRNLEEDKIFYLMSRGLTRDTARTTMVTGFLRGAINRVENKELGDLFKPSFLRD